MAKPKCQLCGHRKAQRLCEIKGGIGICSVCCFEERSRECEDCRYYESSLQYEIDKCERPAREEPFVAEIIPEIDKECNRILSRARSGHAKEAEREMKELYEKFPAYHSVLFGLGVCCALQEKYEKAATFFRKAVDVFPCFADAHFNLAMTCLKIGDMAGVVGGVERSHSDRKRREARIRGEAQAR